MELNVKQPIIYTLPPVELKHLAGHSALISVDLPSTDAYSSIYNEFLDKIDIFYDSNWKVDVDIVSKHGSDTVKIHRSVSRNDLINLAMFWFLKDKELFDKGMWKVPEGFPVYLFGTLNEALNEMGFKGDPTQDDESYEYFKHSVLDAIKNSHIYFYDEEDVKKQAWNFAGFMIANLNTNGDFNENILRDVNKEWMFFLYLSPEDTNRLTFNNKYDVECEMTINCHDFPPFSGIKFTINKSELPSTNSSADGVGTTMGKVLNELYSLTDPDDGTNIMDEIEEDSNTFENLMEIIFYHYRSICTAYRPKVLDGYDYSGNPIPSTKLGELTEDEFLKYLLYVSLKGREERY